MIFRNKHTHFIGLLCLLFYLTGCSGLLGWPGASQQPPAEMPDDFLLQLNWSTGPMPDRLMEYSYSVTMESGKKGLFKYRSSNGLAALEDFFTVEEEKLRLLYNLLLSKNAFRNQWEMNDPIDGGPDITFSIKSGGTIYPIPPVSELSDSEREDVYAIFYAVTALVPDSLFLEMEEIQLTREF